MLHNSFRTRSLVQGAILIAAGVLLPQAFHAFGQQAGSMFLPMHLPVILAGFMLGPVWGLLVGCLTPVLSYLFTGMPPVPVLFFMIAELGVYGLSAGFLIRRARFGVHIGRINLDIYICLLIAMLAGRAAAGLAAAAAFWAGSFRGTPVAYVTGAVVTGLPGIAVQIVVLPVLFMALKKGGFVSEPASKGN